jgi:hypothetical protein
MQSDLAAAIRVLPDSIGADYERALTIPRLKGDVEAV